MGLSGPITTSDHFVVPATPRQDSALFASEETCNYKPPNDLKFVSCVCLYFNFRIYFRQTFDIITVVF